MSNYSQAELLTEVSKIFRAELTPVSTGGTLNTAEEYRQLLEMGYLTFLFNQDAVFYVALMARNRLTSTMLQEVAVLEDMLVALEDLAQLGAPVKDKTSLSNARTAALSLDAAQSVTNRPETARFVKQMDSFASQVKKNLVSPARGNILVRPREDARNIIQSNLTLLNELHTNLLEQLNALEVLLEDFLSLDIPSKVSSSVLKSISLRLQDAINKVGTLSDTQNLEANRDLFLQTLANKVGVKLLSTFTDPSEFKFRSPNNPIPPTAKHLGYVVGQGTPASILTNGGPWPLPVSDVLSIRVSDGATVTIALDDIPGAAINARNEEPYTVTAAMNKLHVVVDENIYVSDVSSSTISTATVVDFLPLGFKHLGTIVSFVTTNAADSDDFQLRFITDLRLLQSAVSGNIVYASSLVTVTSFVAGDEAAIGFDDGHVGGYIKDSSGNKFEILQVISPTQCLLDVRGMVPDFSVNLELRGSFSSGSGATAFQFSPSTTNVPVGETRIGPTVKTATLTLGARSVVNVISDIESEVGAFDSGCEGATLNWHVIASAAAGDSTRLSLRPRTRANPYVQIAGRFVHVSNTPVAPVIEDDSAHPVLGFREGELEAGGLLTPNELVSLLNEQAGLVSEVVETEIVTGTLRTSGQTAQVTDLAGRNLATIGVVAGDQLELLDGISAGVYRVSTASVSVMTLEDVIFSASESGLRFRVVRERVQIHTADAGPDTSLEVLTTPTELGLPTTKTYSSISSFEALDLASKNLKFTGVVAGDFLRIVGSSDEIEIEGVEGESILRLATGLPANTARVGFEIRSAAARAYHEMNSRLTSFLTAKNLLSKNGFNESVGVIDNAMTAAILPGQNFAASRNQARRYVAELLSLLTTTYLRQEEYTTSIPTAPDNMADILGGYAAVSVPGVDGYIEALLERKYNRAADLLRQGRFTSFFGTNEETGSYSGAVLSASRKAVRDLPAASRTRFDMLREGNTAQRVTESTDSNEDFTDITTARQGSDT